MKVIYVIDSVSNINSKISLLKNRFGDNIFFVVKAGLVKIFETYNYPIHAIYGKNLPKIVHTLLLNSTLEDVVFIKSSLDIDDKILNKFIKAIGDKSKVVNVMPTYNIIEDMSNAAYNVYVNALFKIKDSTASSKMQFLPQAFVLELLNTNFANRLFEIEENLCVNITFNDKKTNNNFKTKTGFNRNLLIPIIVALAITVALVFCLALIKKISYLLVLTFIFVYVLDILFTIIYQCKLYFDERFFK